MPVTPFLWFMGEYMQPLTIFLKTAAGKSNARPARRLGGFQRSDSARQREFRAQEPQVWPLFKVWGGGQKMDTPVNRSDGHYALC